ncbi:MAG: hypothetical protein WAS51_13765 [Ilumatobacteraceae bacterium]
MTYTQKACGSEDVCISDGTSYSTSNTTSSGCSMVSWDFLSSETYWYAKLSNFSYGGSGSATYNTNNTADQVRNRMSGTGRTVCWFNGNDLGGSPLALPYYSTTWNTLSASYNEFTSSVEPIPAGASC